MRGSRVIDKFAGAAASLPQIEVASTPAQDKHTPQGMTPPVGYTKVNTDDAPTPDAGAQNQKSQPPMGAQMLPKTATPHFSREDFNMRMTSRPLIQDLVKEAVAKDAQRAKIAAEGARQMGETSKEASAPVTTGDQSISTDFALKLAAAVEYATPILVKSAGGGTHTPNTNPDGVSESHQAGHPPGPGEQGHGHAQPPKSPGLQASNHGPANQMENTINHHVPGTQTTAMSGGKGKTASAAEELGKKNLACIQKIAKAIHGSAPVNKIAAAPPPFEKKEETKEEDKDKKEEEKRASPAKMTLVEHFLHTVKTAEDAINPAKITAGAAVPPDTSAAGENGGAPVAGMPQGPRGLVGSNDSAINYKKQTAYAPRKSELAQYFNEPALSSATDKTLQQAFAHTGEAGVKISSAPQVKTAAARAVLMKLAEGQKGG